MALISPNAKHFVKLTRNVLVAGKGKIAGDVVDVDLATKRKLIGMGVAIEHAPLVEDLQQTAEKAVSKAKGK